MNYRIVVLTLLAAVLTVGASPAFGQECIFRSAQEGSLGTALGKFHDVMSQLIHGPAERGEFGPVKDRAPELAELRDVILASSLPQSLAERCVDISAKARELSAGVDQLLAASQAGGGDEEVEAGLERVHTAYRELNGSLTTLEDLLDSFHTLLRPLWHNAYPARDVEAMKAAAPRLRIRARLIQATAEKWAPERAAKAERLQESVAMLDEAIAADDGPSVLEALRIVHDRYEELAAGDH